MYISAQLFPGAISKTFQVMEGPSPPSSSPSSSLAGARVPKPSLSGYVCVGTDRPVNLVQRFFSTTDLISLSDELQLSQQQVVI
jgi:hypothetical protein